MYKKGWTSYMYHPIWMQIPSRLGYHGDPQLLSE